MSEALFGCDGTVVLSYIDERLKKRGEGHFQSRNGRNPSPTGTVPLQPNTALDLFFHTGEPLQYHALGVKPFRIPWTEKYAIQKVKPIQRTTMPPAHNKQPPSTPQFISKSHGENSEKYQQVSSDS